MPARKRRRYMRFALFTLVILTIIFAIGAVVAWRMLAASLPRLAGEVDLPGLAATVTIERDDVGVARITGQNQLDVTRALGYAHAQDRYFQMDLARRMPAGELAQLLGAAALPLDRQNRVHRFRHVAGQVLANLPERHRDLIRVYTEGVNAGLASLGAAPPEYLVARAAPAPWTDEDCLLVVFSMTRGLNFHARWEKDFGVMRAALAEEVFEFLTPHTTRDDVPVLVRDEAAEAQAMQPAPIPGPDVVDARAQTRDTTTLAHDATADPDVWLGSNAWAVAGARTTDGRAILANDMHLGLSVPGTWYRAEFEWAGRVASGVTLPGVPALVAGATEHIAWGFTNVYADAQDYVIIEVDPDDHTRYRTPEGWESFTVVESPVNIKGRAAEPFTIRTTRWGPVVDDDWLGAPLALRWTAHDPDKTNLHILDLVDAQNVDDAVAVARTWFGPAQNFTVADADGRVAWVVTGYLPNRVGVTGKTPESWAEPGAGWIGAIAEADRPVVIDPPEGYLFSANNRTAGVDQSRRISHPYGSSDRAYRINDVLAQSDGVTERDMLALQLDTRVRTLDRYRDIIAALAESSDDEQTTRAAELAANWNATSDADQRAYRLLRRFRTEVREVVLAPLLTPCFDLDDNFRYRWPLADEPVERILDERPAHLLPSIYTTWDECLEAALHCAMTALENSNPAGVDIPWGQAHQVVVQHPISRLVPALGRFLDMPRAPLPGDTLAVRVGGPGFGASQRTIVSPNHWDDAILHIPAGQSGHFLSRFYKRGHADWVAGNPTPMRAGEARHSLTLHPSP